MGPGSAGQIGIEGHVAQAGHAGHLGLPAAARSLVSPNNLASDEGPFYGEKRSDFVNE